MNYELVSKPSPCRTVAKTVSEFECVPVKSAFTEDHGCGLTCEHVYARTQSARALKTMPYSGFYSGFQVCCPSMTPTEWRIHRTVPDLQPIFACFDDLLLRI